MYFIVPSDLKGIEIVIYYYCCKQTNFQDQEYKGKKKFEFNISLRTIEDDISIERRSVSRVLKRLVELDYIELIEKGKPPKKPSKYLLKFTKNIVNNSSTINATINNNIDCTIQDVENTKVIDNSSTIDCTMQSTIVATPSNISSNIISNNIAETKKEIPKKYIELYEYWNSLKIVKHKDLTEDMVKAMSKALKKYDIETIKTSIKNYEELLHDERYYFDYEWTLKDFVTGNKRIPGCLEDGSYYRNYKKDIEKLNKKSSSSPIERKVTHEYVEF